MQRWHHYLSISAMAATLLLAGIVHAADGARLAYYPEGEAVQITADSRVCGPETMTQSTVPDTLAAGSAFCPSGDYTRQACLARSFPLTSDITVNCVRVGVQLASVDCTVAVNIYQDTSGGQPDTASLRLLGTRDVDIPAETSMQMFTADFSALGGVFVPGGLPMVVEIAAPDLTGLGRFLIGANHHGEAAPGYIKSAPCGEPDFVTLAHVGYPSVHLVIDVDYYFGADPPYGACCYPNGECVFELQAECLYGGGIFQGRDVTCEVVSCPQPDQGACCSATGSCTPDDAWDCGRAGGTWLGAGVACGGDCDSDGASDRCEIALGLAQDCNGNGVPDACDISSGYSCDNNENGIPDECDAWMAGDMDCNGTTNVFDIDPFVVALTNCEEYQRRYPCCNCMNADANYDGAVNVFDIDPFVRILTEPLVITPTELAGNSLATYPYFEYVRAFNVNAPIKLALDPSRYHVTGRTADVYVVEKKKPAEWASDPTLVDVTAGGAMRVSFSGTTIQANTFEIVGPNELDTAVYQAETVDYTGFGHGYDMIVDMNRNGILDGGDYIDGLDREAGLYVCHDSTQAGPLAYTEVLYSVGTMFGIPASKPAEDLYYPTDIARMGQLPLLVISHGNGHDYQWYDHIGRHMASYGYVVMSHQNNTGPGSSTAAMTTCGHTDAFLQLLPVIADGALVGHVDTSRIIWCGHSRGAEGVAKAYHNLVTGAYTPRYYSSESIVLVDSMLPIDTGGIPGDVNYHLWTASGDFDVDGSAEYDSAQTFHLHERATRYRGSTIVQGTGHAWFHDAGGDPWFEGPCPINEDGVHLVQLGLMLPIYKHYAEGNVPGEDYMWRQYERFHPPAVPVGENPCFVVSQEYRSGDEAGTAFIDDYETQPDPAISSSGGAVTYNVTNLVEGRMDDTNSSFTWSSSDPFNGATQDGASDPGRGVVFDWNGTNKYYEWAVVGDQRDFAAWRYVSLRGAQGTQHPYTMMTDGVLTFTITLRDAAGHTSAISTGAYGGGFGMPYDRLGGWHNEMRRIRIRTTDFLTNGSELDLANIAAVRLDFGPSWGTNQGRIVIDELMLDNDEAPSFMPLRIGIASDTPDFVPAGVPITVEVAISENCDLLVTDSALLHYRYTRGEWSSTPLQRISDLHWRCTLPAPVCGDRPEYYCEAKGEAAGVVFAPVGGSAAPVTCYVGSRVNMFADDFGVDLGWTVSSAAGMSSGMWQRVVPGGAADHSPSEDYDGSGYCYVTDNRAGYDVDGGPTHVISPVFNLSAADGPVVRFANWMYCDDSTAPQMDYLDVYVSSNGGSEWVLADHIPPHEVWSVRDIRIADFVPLTATVQVRFTVADNPNNSMTEAGVDAVTIFDVQCN